MKAVVAAFFAFNQDPVGAFSVIAKIQRFVCSSSSSQQQGLVILSRHTEEGSSVGRGGDAAAGAVLYCTVLYCTVLYCSVGRGCAEKTGSIAQH